MEFGKGVVFHYEQDSTIFAHIEKSIQNYPQHIALIDADITLSYSDLEKKVTKFSQYLYSIGIKMNDRVAIHLMPSADMVIAILATIKIGACFVPLNPTYPKDRIDFLLKNINPHVILTIDSSSLEKATYKIVNIKNLIEAKIIHSVEPFIDGDTPAYIIYTSGSTGEPKGVVVPHRAVNNHMLWMQNEFNFTPSERILFKTPLSFDPSIWEIFLPLFCGATIVIAPANSHIEPRNLATLIDYYEISTIQLVPIILQKLLDYGSLKKYSSLKRVFVGGESVPSYTKKYFFDQASAELINLYGPTEATIDSTFYRIEKNNPHFEINCIGKPIYNSKIYILDDALQPCKMDEEGEVFISGDNLALGYFNNEVLTQEKFMPNPFESGTVMYRTGDRAKWTADGNIEYLGRLDHQIKLNGIRLELNEMTSHINQIENVDMSILEKVVTDQGDAHLVCYILPKKNKEVNINALKKEMQSFFQKEISPRQYYILEYLPLTVNGKLNREALPLASKQGDYNAGSLCTKNNATAIKLSDMWRNVLHLNMDAALDDDFYELGGSSLSTVSLIFKITNEFGIHPSMSEMMTHSKLKNQADYINCALSKKGLNVQLDKDSNMICLKNTGTQLPIFLIHPIGGTVFWYKHLASLLQCNRKIYAISDPGISNPDYNVTSIVDIAEHYTHLIRNMMPHGPYLVGGASFGATVAIEIARNMERYHEKVAGLFIFDGWGIYPDQLKDPFFFKNMMESQQEEWRSKFYVESVDVQLDALFKAQMKKLDVLYKYKMCAFDYPMALFKSEETLPLFQPIDDPNNHWDKYAKNYKARYIIPGNHETMFQYPNVIVMAKYFQEALDKLTDVGNN